MNYLNTNIFTEESIEETKHLLEAIDEFFVKKKNELFLPIPEIKNVAQDLGENWLMCPLCQDAWQSQTKDGMVLCPKCNNKLHNPKFDSSFFNPNFLIKNYAEINVLLSINELSIIFYALNKLCQDVNLREVEILIGADREEILFLKEEIYKKIIQF